MFENAVGAIIIVAVTLFLMLTGCAPNAAQHQAAAVSTATKVQVTIFREPCDTVYARGEIVGGKLYVWGEEISLDDLRYADATIGIKEVK